MNRVAQGVGETRRPTPKDRVLGGAIRAGLFLFRHLPVWFSFLIADGVAVILVAASWIREKRVGRGVVRNLRIAFRDELSPALARRLLWGWARHMCRLPIEFAKMPTIQRDNLERHVECEELRTFVAQHDPSRGMICVTGHIGVPELLGHVTALIGVTVSGVFRSPGNPVLNAVLEEVRTSGGQRVISKWGSVWPLKKALDRREAIGLAADENTSKNPVFVPFFETLAATSNTPAMLHLKSGAPLVISTVVRTGRLRYRARIWDVIRHEPTDDRPADIEAILTRMNAALSRAILEHPTQWFWGMRRFHTRPEGEDLGPDGLPPRVEI